MKWITLLLVLVAAAGLFLPWMELEAGSVALADPAAGEGRGNAPDHATLMDGSDGPILLGCALAAVLLLLAGGGAKRRRWPLALGFLALAAFAVFSYVDWQGFKDSSDFVRIGRWVFGKPRSVGIGPLVSTAASVLSALLALVSFFRGR